MLIISFFFSFSLFQSTDTDLRCDVLFKKNSKKHQKFLLCNIRNISQIVT